jgi:hypothetical protein
MVSSLLIPSEHADSKHTPHAMAITLDVDAIPGLRDVFDRQRAGEEFDVECRWGALMDADGTESPLALVDLYLPDVNLGVEIIIDADRYPDSLLAGVRSGTIYLLDPDLSQELQKRDISSAITEYRPLVIKPPDPKPVVGILQQRHDLPLETYQPEFRDVTAESHNAEVCAFIERTRPITSYAIQYHPDGSPTILIVESALDEIREAVHEDAKLEGRWALLAGKEHNLLRFDGFADGHQLGRWLLPDPQPNLVRAGAAGPHIVVMTAEVPTKEQHHDRALWEQGLALWVSHVEVLRKLLLKLPADSET